VEQVGLATTGMHEDLGWALATALRAYGRSAETALAGLPGGPRGYRLLCAVARDCPRSQLALAQHTGLDRTVVTYLVDDLSAQGLVERQPDPVDRRTRRVVATGRGLERLADLDARLAQVEDHLLAPLAPEDRPALRALLQQLARGLHEAGTAALTCPEVERLQASDP
jgi:DNA-binding MarR family transcriptional regulator